MLKFALGKMKYIWVRKEKKEINKVNSGSVEVPRGSRSEVGTAHAWKRLTGTRKKLILIQL